ncbi:glycosyl transferase [Catenuloplanes niger JCM 9533]
MVYAALSVLVTSRLWADPGGRVLAANEDDHGFFLFVLAHAERAVFHGEGLFYTDRLNFPDGINMMANTSILALGIPVSPITHWFGPGVSMALLITIGLGGTAAAWYWVLGRHFVGHRSAAFVAGLWGGFAPTMISHANGHINFTVLILVPFLFWRVAMLREPAGAVRNGVVLGLLITAQVFVNEEILLFVALACAIFTVCWVLMHRDRIRTVWKPGLTGLAVAAGTSGVLLAYPLFQQFLGRQHYRGLPFTPDVYVTDLASYVFYARQSIAGHTALAESLSVSATEDNSFFGLPLVVLLVVCAVLTWRQRAMRAVVITGLVFVIIAAGPTLVVGGVDTEVPMPLFFVSHLPLINLITTTRFTMVVVWACAFLLAVATDRVLRARDEEPDPATARRRVLLWWVTITVALLPVAPKPLITAPATPMPELITSGQWREFVPDGRSLVPVPLPEVTVGREGMRMAAFAALDAPVPRGYFMGPTNGEIDPTGTWNAPARRTSDILFEIVRSGRAPVVTPADRAAARDDLKYWRAGALVLGERHAQAEILKRTVSDLLGREPRLVGGAWVWEVSDLPV